MGRRGRLAGWTAALAAIVVAGILTIGHYSSLGGSLADSADPPAVTAGTVARAAAANGTAGAASAARQARGTAGAARSGTAGSSAAAVAASPSGSASRSTAASHSASQPGSSTSPSANASRGKAPVHFRTLPPSVKLPTNATCARWVRQRPRAENKSANKAANHTTGQHVGAKFFAAGDSPQAGRKLAPRISGNFTGTTKEILRWAACKWGIDQNVVFAQAAVESWWQQGTLGDWGTDASACPPGHKLGADGKSGQCPQSYGILQNRYPYEQASWPGIGRSTAMNADTAYAIWRSCYDGYEVWLNNVPHGQTYHKGDLWGCVGRWFAGRWHTAPAQQYVTKVKQYLRERIWLTRDFQQG